MMKLVKFKSGHYGVRTYWFFGWNFIDLVNPRFAWRKYSRHFEDCKGNQVRAREIIAGWPASKHKVVK